MLIGKVLIILEEEIDHPDNHVFLRLIEIIGNKSHLLEKPELW